MNSIFQLVKTIKPMINSGTKLSKIRYILNNYNADDIYNFYTNSHPKTYNKIKLNLTNSDDLFEIILISWGAGAKSPIHNHPPNGCLMKVLSGSLQENHYNIVNDSLQLYKINQYYRNDINYIDDKLGYHSIINNTNKIVHSLHIYSPPNFKIKTFKNII